MLIIINSFTQNFDNYFDHLSYESTIKNEKKMIKYVVLNSSAKGQYTYEYFRLKELEVDTINNAQGIRVDTIRFSDFLSRETIEEIELLLNDLKNR